MKNIQFVIIILLIAELWLTFMMVDEYKGGLSVILFIFVLITLICYSFYVMREGMVRR